MVPLHMLILSVVISIIYGVMKGVEIKYIDDGELPPLKNMVRDAVIVFSSAFASIFLYSQVGENAGNLLGGFGFDLGSLPGFGGTTDGGGPGTQAFTGEPGF